MNPYNFSLLFFSFCTFFIAILIWLKRGDQIGRRYFIFSAAVTVWGVAEAIQFTDRSPYDLALFAGRISNMGAVFIPATWLHFTWEFSGKNRPIKSFLTSLYLLSLVIDLFGFTSWFIPYVKPAAGIDYYIHPGPIYHVFTLMFFIVVPFGFLQLTERLRRSNKEEAVQTKGFIVATTFGFIGGALTFLPAYDIMLPQYGLIAIPVYPFLTAYFMIRHRLFDIEAIAQAFQKEKLATIGLLAASINHEIRNPLYIAKGTLETYLENKKEGLLGRSDSEQSAEKALKQIDRALEVIRKLNYFAKPSNEASLDRAASIPQAIETVFDLIAHILELSKIAIHNEIKPDLPLIQMDQRQLEETLFNLIVNACQAMPEGGELILTSKVQTKTLMLSIQDTGTGMKPEHLKHLFEPFRTTKGDKGTGLGLYITKQLIERNKGRISVRSQEGKGTVFTLTFRIAP